MSVGNLSLLMPFGFGPLAVTNGYGGQFVIGDDDGGVVIGDQLQNGFIGPRAYVTNRRPPSSLVSYSKAKKKDGGC